MSFSSKAAATITEHSKFAYSIFGRTSYIKQIGSCAIIVRHGQIGPAQSITDTAGLIVDWIPENSSLAIRLINISLEPSEHRFDLYSPACWKYFHTLRFIHRKQLQYLFDTLRGSRNPAWRTSHYHGRELQRCPSIPNFLQTQFRLSGLLQTERCRLRSYATCQFPSITPRPSFLHAAAQT